MKIQPYTTVGQIHFGATAQVVASILGNASRTSTDRLGRTQLHYSELIVRLVNAAIVEISAKAETVEFPDVAIPFQHLARFLRKHDPTAFESVGFTVSPAYGVALDPNFPTWVTAFAKSEVDAWRKYAA
jgi:hypothetical protein